MRRSLPFLVLLLATAACGQQSGSPPERSDRESAAPRTSFEAGDSSNAIAEPTMERAAAGPNVSPTAAPGVAFNYRYAFRLAAPRVAEVQERHAQMCEQLGVAHCRITGMLYRVVNERDIEARLELKLDPGAARAFGRDAVQRVVEAEGMLTESEISGVDVGTAIRAAGRSLAELTAELDRVEARLRAARNGSGEKSQLEYEAQQLREQIRALRQTRDTQQETLATTPMVFQYGSGDLVPGFAQRPTLKQAMRNALDGFLDGANILLIILVTLLPWAIAIGLVWWLVAFVLRRRRRVTTAPEADAPAA